MIRYKSPSGEMCRCPSAHFGLINWFVDLVDPNGTQIVYVADERDNFLTQILAAVERVTGKVPRIDRDKDLESLSLDVLTFLGACKKIEFSIEEN